MARRRVGRTMRSQSILPLRTGHRLPNSLSCWFCEFKIYAFNDRLFSFGWRHARFLKVWFAIGVAFSFLALIGSIMILLWELAGNFHLGREISVHDHLSVSWLFGTTSLVPGLSLSVMDTVIIVFSTLFSVAVHELGHAIAAASTGLQIEYIAVFLAIIFPGALVAFNYDLLQSLPRFSMLRIYCAGIWLNAVCCAVCGLLMLCLPLFLSPLYMHNEGPMVLEVPPVSPLSKYLTRGDVILSVDGANISNSYEWMKKMQEVDSRKPNDPYSVQNSHSQAVNHGKGYCVPNSLLEGSMTLLADDQFSCPDELAAFTSLSCYNSSSLIENSNSGSENNGMETKHCLIAMDVVKLRKCGDGWLMAGKNNCACSEKESCMKPVLIPSMSWVEVSYSSPYTPQCSKPNERGQLQSSESGLMSCGGTFVFLGDILSMARSLQLSSYRPRLPFMIFSAYIPVLFEKILACIFHVSATLGFLNSLPVFFLDGESILETGLCYITWLNTKCRRRVLQFCLVGGTLLSTIVFLWTFYCIIVIHN
ncbi:Membrane-bound transcription factor site-2 protease protein [Dioscorea alata]|uniref:Membrane-bound transcription factor site-2 protease protein n=1 Tax=Dioscorea alata TaxID=55571 RepID=A0ACB7WDF5_DIOAL|nr:Membrane-bound transcription factor site-2 protease protein [Dioscorea alata]